MIPPPGAGRPRLLLLLPTSTYRAEAFIRAADRLGIDLTIASEKPSAFQDAEPAGLVTLPFDDLIAATSAIRQFHSRHPLAATFGVDDRTALLAARLAHALGLRHNPVAAVAAAADKHAQRRRLADAAVPVPPFRLCHTDQPVDLEGLSYPVVLKPLHLSASRGVIRVDSVEGLAGAVDRLAAILHEAAGNAGSAGHPFLIEAYVPGDEYALEGLLDDGVLRVLALFDKPEPLTGPYFAETLYVTPSRAPSATQEAVIRCAQAACRALGLSHGPVHVELRANAEGAWLIELAARPIGGRCGEVLRFGRDGKISLEQIHLARALGDRLPVVREASAAGVAMLPVPRAGRFAGVTGLEEARATPLVTGITLTVARGERVRPLPDAARYLGFIFARGPVPAAVEAALVAARARLGIEVGPPAQ